MPRRASYEDSSEDDLPSVEEVMRQCKPPSRERGRTTAAKSRKQPEEPSETPKEGTMRRHRLKLGQTSDNPLLRPLGQTQPPQMPAPTRAARSASASLELDRDKNSRETRVELRARKPKTPPDEATGTQDAWFSEEDATVVEEITIVDDSVYFSFSSSEDEEEDGDFDDSLEDALRKRSTRQPRAKPQTGRANTDALFNDIPKTLPAVRSNMRPEKPEADDGNTGKKVAPKSKAQKCSDPEPTSDDATKEKEGPPKRREKNPPRDGGAPRSLVDEDLTGPFSKLRIEPPSLSSGPTTKNLPEGRKSTPPPTTPPKPRPDVLASPTKKIPRIPQTPHGPGSDAFWSQELTDDWNETYSPRKLFAPPATKSPTKQSPTKQSPTKKEAAAQREAKRTFESAKHAMADGFLRELDQAITSGKLGELAASTGGIRIQWTNKLNTTAGRANWRKETVRTRRFVRGDDGATKEEVSVTHRHNASIELAEKVIDSEDRLLNVIAHEFCHLANFMVSGVTGNPHGREFKTWAARVSQIFGGRGIQVTTKHSYDIDFKYVWECSECAMEYKRHSKSINPQRHRCGVCRAELRQTKPVPRRPAATAKPSEYQQFMRDQMKVIRQENPGSPQKDIMKQVAERWAKKTVKTHAEPLTTTKSAPKKGTAVESIADAVINLTLDDDRNS